MYLVTYDISSDRLRGKVAKKLEDYGRRVQYSVFECRMDAKRCKAMHRELVKLIGQEEQAGIRIYVLDAAAEQKTLTIGTSGYIQPDEELDVLFI